MNQSLLSTFLGMSSEPIEGLSFLQIFILFGHSLILGSILTILTYITMTPLIKAKLVKGGGANLRTKIILGSSNILFLCVGLTGVMILVNNNLARALSIGATMGLIRFRVKLGAKNLGSNLLFGIIAGVACGLQEIKVAWVVTGVYILLQSALYFILNKSGATPAQVDNQ